MRIGTHGSEGPTQAGARRRVSRVYQGAWRAGCGKAAASCLRKERRAGVVTGRLRDRHRRGAGKAPYYYLRGARPAPRFPTSPLWESSLTMARRESERGNDKARPCSPSPFKALEGRVDSRRRRLDGRADERDTFAAPTRKPGKCRNSTTLKFMGKAPRAAAATPPASLRSAPSPQGGGRCRRADVGRHERGKICARPSSTSAGRPLQLEHVPGRITNI
jgi:hypothetical protein